MNTEKLWVSAGDGKEWGSRANMCEVLCVLHWSEEARTAFAKALASYNRAGRPSVPIDSVDYQRAYRGAKRRAKRVAP